MQQAQYFQKQWLSFCYSDVLTRAVVHLFPSSGQGTAPYPVRCRLSLFGEGIEPTSVSLEGVRLHQPDGIRLDEVFPVLREKPGRLFGLAIDMSPQQARVNLENSGCVIELCSQARSVKFRPKKVLGERDVKEVQPASLVAIQDAHQESSVVVVNASQQTVTPRVRVTPNGNSQSPTTLRELSALSVAETRCDSHWFELAKPRDLSTGPVRALTVTAEVKPEDEVAYFLVNRDAQSRKLVSVSAL